MARPRPSAPRTPENCEHRRGLPSPVGDAVHYCRLTSELIGTRDLALSAVVPGQCEVCCRQRVPRREDLNPLVATTVYKAAHKILQAGGMEGCGPIQAEALMDFAQGFFLSIDALIRARNSPPVTSPRLAECRYLGPELPAREPAAGGREPVLACHHPLHAETTISRCRKCFDYQSGAGRSRVETWAIGLTTAPRRRRTLAQTLRSLRQAGWAETVHVFAEEGAPIPRDRSGLGPLAIVRRQGPTLGAWGNFFLSLSELYLRSPRADAYLLLQDDVLFCRDLRPYLQKSLWPGPKPGVVSLHTPSHLAPESGTGFFRADLGWSAWGAQALIFSSAAARAILADARVVNHRLKGLHDGRKNVDCVLGDWCRRSGHEYWLHAPSLTQHTGETSTLWESTSLEGRRRASDFPGDTQPIAKLLRKLRQKRGAEAPDSVRVLADNSLEVWNPTAPAPAATTTAGHVRPNAAGAPAKPVHVVFGLTIFTEPPAQVDWCLTFLRRSYPASTVIVVTDGPHPEADAMAEVCRRHRARFHPGERLKMIEHGAAWWKRLLALARDYQPDWFCKLDADTRLVRPLDFHSAPPGADVLGRVTTPGFPHENVQGGFQAIRGSAVARILQSGECDAARWRDPDHWARGDCSALLARREISTDYVLMGILRTLGLRWAHFDPIDSHWKTPPQWRLDAAVTHPHKGMTLADTEPPGISFCTTCYNRLTFLQQTLPSNLAGLDLRDEIVLLDYGSTDGLWDWIKAEQALALRSGQLKYFRGETRGWHVSHAKNVAHRQARQPVVCNLDADNFLPVGFADWLREIFFHGGAITHGGATSFGGGYGRIALLREDFLRLGGYDERFVGWSYDDEDLRRRTVASGIRAVATPEPFIRFLPHSHAIRHFAPNAKTQEEDLAFGRAITRASLAEGRLRANDGLEWGKLQLLRRLDPQPGARKLVCVSSYFSGVRHRFALLNQVKNFGALYGYEVHFLWGVSKGVAYCRWEELFGPIDGLRVSNIPEEEVVRLTRLQESQESLDYEGDLLEVVRDGRAIGPRIFAYNLPASGCLEQLVPNSARPKKRLLATPSAAVRQAVERLAHEHQFARRTGLRIRVTESPSDRRKPHRLPDELDDCLAPLLQLDPALPVFIVTDSEYLEERLVAHFRDAVCLPKQFDLLENGSRYVHRCDQEAMVLFVQEAFSLCACRRVINIGGFLNEQAATLWKPPYAEALAVAGVP